MKTKQNLSGVIKLWEVQGTSETRRFQSQLSLGKDSVDFIMKDGKMFNWAGRGDWIEFLEDYIIIPLNK